jgi:tetratricopeptide (TPR) repeat protein
MSYPNASDVVKKADEVNQFGTLGESYGPLKDAYGKAFNSKSDKIAILERLAPAADQIGKEDEALGDYQELNKLNPNSYGSLYAEGELAEKMGRKEVAVQAFNGALAVLKSSPKFPTQQSEIKSLSQRIEDLSK